MSVISRVKYEYETQRLNKLLAEKQIDLDYHIRESAALRQETELLKKSQKEFARIIARNLVAWDTSKDKREGLLPEVYLSNKVLYKQLTGEEYYMHKAMEKFQIGDDYS